MRRTIGTFLALLGVLSLPCANAALIGDPLTEVQAEGYSFWVDSPGSLTTFEDFASDLFATFGAPTPALSALPLSTAELVEVSAALNAVTCCGPTGLPLGTPMDLFAATSATEFERYYLTAEGTLTQVDDVLGGVGVRHMERYYAIYAGPTKSVPEPGTLSLLGAGLFCAAFFRRRRTV